MKFSYTSRQNINRSFSSCTDALNHSLSLDYSLEEISLKDDQFASSWSLLTEADEDEIYNSPIDTKTSRKRKLTEKGWGSSESRKSYQSLNTLDDTASVSQKTIRRMKLSPSFERNLSQRSKGDSWGYFVDAVE